MKKIWLIFFCSSILFCCTNPSTQSENPFALVPEDTSVLLRINSLEGLQNGLKNNVLIHEVDTYNQIKTLKALLLPLDDVNDDYSLLALSKNDNDSLNISYIIPHFKRHSSIDSISEVKIDSSYKQLKDIGKLTYGSNHFYYTFVDSTFFVSNNVQNTKNALRSITTDPTIEKMLSTSDDSKMMTILINHKNTSIQPFIFRDSTLNKQSFSQYTLLDSDVSQNAIYMNGITKANDTTQSLINVFKHTIPQENLIANILPADITGFKSITFDKYQVLRDNLIKHEFLDSLTDNRTLFQNIVEVGHAYNNNQEALILRSLDPSTSFDLNRVVVDNFRGVELYAIENAMSFLNDFAPIISINSANHFINLDDFFIFSNSTSFLESFIANYQNNTTLSESETYAGILENLSDESSLLMYGDASVLNSQLNLNFNDDIKLDISAYKASAIQFVYDTDFAHVNALFKTQKSKGKVNSVNEELNITLDAELAGPPQLVNNHTNNEMDIAVQDIQNNLYLISNQGKVFWKRELDGPILGRIAQIDTYKNGRLQLVFNTKKQLYVLDRNGKDVNKFPLKFNDEITQPVSVFDYDKKKNYRLMITQGKSVLMYDKHGDIVSGFTYKSANNTISSQPSHFRIGSKDYILLAHGNQLEILDRVGKTRIKVKENISFSDNEIYLYNNKFTTSNTNGELLEINQNGNVSHKNLNANSDHKIATTSKTLVVMNDNKLTIKSKTIALDYGVYTAPKIFYINDKIYVTVTDLQAKKGYLFDSQAKPIANFPVYANSQLELDNIDRDNALEVITKGDNDAIIVYEIQ
ncbi:MAG: ribonuclease HII [Algicola sp.]|nr:ribonuclease HII [Algicola sp.]